MGKISVISFDLEGTLVTPHFSHAVWHEELPRIYARRFRMGLQEARARIAQYYDEIGDQRMEWYDVSYWFQRFGLGDYREAMERCRAFASCYPEVPGVLEALAKDFVLIVTSGSTRDFISYLIPPLQPYFSKVFSSTSDYRQLKTPSFYLEVCSKIGVSPGEVVHVGDSKQFDVENPAAVGVRAFHLDRNGRVDKSSLPSLAQFPDIVRSL